MLLFGGFGRSGTQNEIKKALKNHRETVMKFHCSLKGKMVSALEVGSMGAGP